MYKDQKISLKKEIRGQRNQRIRLVFLGEVDGFWHLDYNTEKMAKKIYPRQMIKNAWTYYWHCRKYSTTMFDDKHVKELKKYRGHHFK